MSALAFNTHAAVKKLQEAGFTKQQAEAQTALPMDVIAGELATRRDIEAVKLGIENMQAKLKRDIEALRLPHMIYLNIELWELRQGTT